VPARKDAVAIDDAILEVTRRWLVERLKEGLLQRSRNKIDLDERILVFTGQTNLVERDRIKIAFNAPF
jgi:hypothetical protein